MRAAVHHKVTRVKQQAHAAYTIAWAIFEDAPAKNCILPQMRLLPLSCARQAALLRSRALTMTSVREYCYSNVAQLQQLVPKKLTDIVENLWRNFGHAHLLKDDIDVIGEGVVNELVIVIELEIDRHKE